MAPVTKMRIIASPARKSCGPMPARRFKRPFRGQDRHDGWLIARRWPDGPLSIIGITNLQLTLAAVTRPSARERDMPDSI